MKYSKTLFFSSNFPWSQERISSKFVEGLGTHPQNFPQPWSRPCNRWK